MKPICVKCQRFYRPEKNGYPFVEGMPISSGVRPGAAQAQHWRPYKLWMGDLWRCPGCGNRIVVGVGPSPLAEHFQPDYADKARRYGAQLQVNDC